MILAEFVRWFGVVAAIGAATIYAELSARRRDKYIRLRAQRSAYPVVSTVFRRKP